jgi:myosin heavy subunit
MNKPVVLTPVKTTQVVDNILLPNIGDKIWACTPTYNWTLVIIKSIDDPKKKLITVVSVLEGENFEEKMIVTSDNLKEFKPEDLKTQKEFENLQDLLSLVELHESSLLYVVKGRHTQDLIYVNFFFPIF